MVLARRVLMTFRFKWITQVSPQNLPRLYMMTSSAAIDLNPTEYIAGSRRCQDSLTSATCAVAYTEDLDKALSLKNIKISVFIFFSPLKYQFIRFQSRA